MPNPLGRKLLSVSNPSRYVGGEYGASCKPWNDADLRWALAFPDVYEIGMSHLGLQIIYHILNHQKNILADRVYAPWFDMEELLLKEDQRLWGLETGRPLKDFGIIGITIPYEMTYTNILSVLKLGGVPILSSERGEDDPLVIGGGSGAFNPEPVADFFDAIVLGDGEDIVIEISNMILRMKGTCHSRPGSESGAGSSGNPTQVSELDPRFHGDDLRGGYDLRRSELLEGLSAIKGVYVPKFELTKKIKKAILPNIDQTSHLKNVIVPNIQLVHDRVGVEIQRGCTRGCRFCQAGMVYRPDRQRSSEKIVDLASRAVTTAGLEECAMLSLSAGDYDGLPGVVSQLDQKFNRNWVHISLPSLRTESLTDDVIGVLSRSIKGGFTLAPEAATERLRSVINKGNSEEDLMASVEKIFSMGWKNLKLYFMIGLPTEIDEDIDAIPVVAKKAINLGRKHHKFPNITINVSTFVPKSHTPFQWERQISLKRTKEIHSRLRSKIKGPGLKLKLHGPEISFIEGVFSRGGRELSKVVIDAFEAGCRFDAWDDQLKFGKWIEVFKKNDIDPSSYLSERDVEAALPWDHLFVNLDKDFLKSEREKAFKRESTPDCSRTKCVGCGVCDFNKVGPVLAGDSSIASLPQNDNVVGEQQQKTNDHRLTTIDQRTARYHLRFTKTGNAIFIGHIDLMNIFKRALRRAGLPLKFSEGYNRRPKISFVAALPVGVESRDEWCEIVLMDDLSVDELSDKLSSVFPDGVKILEVKKVLEGAKSISTMIGSCVYKIAYSHLQLRIEQFYTSNKIVVQKSTKKGMKEIDLKESVISLAEIDGRAIEIEIRVKSGMASVFDFARWFFDLPEEDARALPIIKEKTCLTN